MPTTPKGVVYPSSSDHTRLWELFQALALSVDSMKLSGERIATTIRTSNSATTGGTEIVIDTVVAPVVVGRTYRVRWDGRLQSTVAGDDPQIRIREDSLTGPDIATVAIDIPIVSRTDRTTLEAEYTAGASENKTFVLTLFRLAGTGSVSATGATNQPTYFHVDYIRG